MTNLQFEKAQQKAFETLQEQGIVVVKGILPAYNLASEFVEYMKSYGLVPGIIPGFEQHNRIFIWIVDTNKVEGMSIAMEMLRFFLSNLMSFSVSKIIVA